MVNELLLRVEPVPAWAAGQRESEAGQVITVLAVKVIAPWTFWLNRGAKARSARASPETRRPVSTIARDAATERTEMAFLQPWGVLF